LGGGFVVAPPSLGTRGEYTILNGTLADLEKLPALQGLDNIETAPRPLNIGDARLVKIPEGNRNASLWRYCMRQAHCCDDFDALLDVARTFNERAFFESLEGREVVKVVDSVWRCTTEGMNRFGQTGSWSPTAEANRLVPAYPDAFLLLTYLRANNRPKREIWVANGLSEILQWPIKRLSRARRHLITLGYLELIRRPAQGRAAVYRLRSQGGQNRPSILN
jgi:hypothetical protein